MAIHEPVPKITTSMYVIIEMFEKAFFILFRKRPGAIVFEFSFLYVSLAVPTALHNGKEQGQALSTVGS